jgi:hypothetical protein
MNSAAGQGSFAAGRKAQADDDGSFVWGDGSRSVSSSAANQFEVLATGGMGLWVGSGGIASDSLKGISLTAADRPLITRGWDVFASTAGDKAGLGRWGLFMEPSVLVAGIPGDDMPGRSFAVGKYSTNGSYSALMTVDQSGLITCKKITILGGADLAEPFPMSERNVAPGSVVVIDEQNPGRLKLSRRAYDHKVAGVVSGANGIEPGLSMIQEGALEPGHNVALTGRVYVQAEARSGSIEVRPIIGM